MDSTVLELPMVGEVGPDGFDPEGTLSRHLNNLRTEAIGSRNEYIDPHESCLMLYLYGSLNPQQAHRYNKTQGMIQTFVQLATQTPPVATLTPAVVTDGGEPIFTVSGEPRILDTGTSVQFFQPILDLKLQLGRVKQFYRTMAEKAAIFGWYDALYEFDLLTKIPDFRPLPPLQWYKDPTEEELADAHYVGLDWPIDAEEAKRMYPSIAEAIDADASTDVKSADGATAYSWLYLNTQFARPIVTLSIWWLRNHEAPMSDQEAIQAGLVEAREVSDGEATGLPGNENSDAGEVGGSPGNTAGIDHVGDNASGDEDAEFPATDLDNVGDESGSPSAGATTPPETDGIVPAGPAPAREVLIDLKTGAETSQDDPNWPRKLVTRQCIQIANKIVDDKICPHWDFPVISNFNVRVPGTPFGQGEPIRIAEIQKDKNEVHGSTVDHVRWYKGPTSLLPKSMRDEAPESFKNHGMEPNKSYFVDDELIRQWGDKLITQIQPPELPASVLTVNQNLDAAFDDVAGRADALKGNAPTDSASGKLFDATYAAASNATAFRFAYLEEMYYRAVRLTFHSLLTQCTPDDLYAINRTYDLATVAKIQAFALATEWDINMEIKNAATKEQEQQQVREDWKNGLIDSETALEKLGYDKKTITQRMNLQAQAAVAGASQSGQPPQLNGKGQVAQPAPQGGSPQPVQEPQPAQGSY
jgi:hypothetical protein